MKSMKIVKDRKLLDTFVHKDTEYTPETKAAFRRLLAENGITLSEKTANFMLKDWLLRFRKKPLFDLEFDNQLDTAVRQISGS